MNPQPKGSAFFNAHMRILKLWILVACFAMAMFGTDGEFDRKTLKGAGGFMVQIAGITSKVEALGLTPTMVKTDVELRLRQAGLTIIDEKLSDAVTPTLFVSLATSNDNGLIAFGVEVQFNQMVSLLRNRYIVNLAPTWSVGAVGVVGTPHFNIVRTHIKDLVDMFINAYLSVNPK